MSNEPQPGLPPESRAGASSPAAPGWHRLHPVTPLLRSWKVIAAFLALVTQQSWEGISRLAQRSSFHGGWVVGAVVVCLLVLLIGWCLLAWRMTRYRLSGEAIEYHSGILFRQQKQAQLDRLQAVDVVRPLLGRLLGLSELRIEVAGGHGSDFRLSYLTEDDANRLRRTLLAGSAGVDFGEAEAPEAPEVHVFELPTDRLIWSIAWSGLAVGSLIYAVLAGAVGFYLLRDGQFRASLSWSSVSGLLPSLGVFAAVWAQFTRRFNFQVAHSPDGVRLRHGLLEHRSQTVPPGRIQALEISQPLLWRRRGWWNVTMNVAGYAGELDDGQTSATTLVAVAEVDELLRVLPLVLPDLGHPEPLAVLRAGMTGTSLDDESARLGYINAPVRSRALDLYGWKRHGVLATHTALLLRGGLVVRRLTVVPHARVQSIQLHQGPFQRRLDVATIALHSTPGPIQPQVEHLASADAARLLQEQVSRSAAARAAAGPEKWMQDDHKLPSAVVDLMKQPPPQ